MSFLVQFLGIVVLVCAVTPMATLAAGPLNIQGPQGKPGKHGAQARLESIVCRGAYVKNLREALREGEEENVASPCNRLPFDSEERDHCEMAEFVKHADIDREAILTISADPGRTTFTARIESDGETKFSSSRTAHFITSPETYLFERLGMGEDDIYTMEVTPNWRDRNRGDSALVPVKRRLLPDLIYVFMDGCDFTWATP